VLVAGIVGNVSTEWGEPIAVVQVQNPTASGRHDSETPVPVLASNCLPLADFSAPETLVVFSVADLERLFGASPPVLNSLAELAKSGTPASWTEG